MCEQARMNKYFLGKKVMMAERYASMLKTMFVTLFFSAIFPQGYYVAAVALFMTYWVRWKQCVCAPPRHCGTLHEIVAG